jgi:hypothetical protein
MFFLALDRDLLGNSKVTCHEERRKGTEVIGVQNSVDDDAPEAVWHLRLYFISVEWAACSIFLHELSI